MDDLKERLISIADKAVLAKSVWEELSRRIIYTLEKSPEVFYNISRYGWYIDNDMTPVEVFSLNDMIAENKIAELDELLVNYYEKNLDRILSEIIIEYPSRKTLIEEGFNNFKEKRYASSIVLLITQIDGICYDKCEKLFFRNQRQRKVYKPEIEAELSKIKNAFLECTLSPIKTPSVVNEHISNIKNFPVTLNRHAIIHGHVKTFNDRLNNLKIISLLNYIKQILEN